ncbi:MAG TPA: hypothetical protein VGX03_10765 [Candidatus Binatia bacterium]|jgi:hypothetical protein|nr:hypothetical protein [Candidatus Binatia bacterium]
MRAALLFSLFLISLVRCGPVVAQPSPYGSANGNLGTWTWGKPQSPQGDEGEERAPGETSWERLHAEHQVEGAPPAKERPLINSLSPLRWWRLLRGKHDDPNVQQNDGQNTEQHDEENDEHADEPGNE